MYNNVYLHKVLFRVLQSKYRLIFGVLVNWFPPKKVTTIKMAAKGDNSSLTMDLFRWFKFTLKPPYSITHGKLRLTIWDTSFWTFWLKFGHKGP